MKIHCGMFRVDCHPLPDVGLSLGIGFDPGMGQVRIIAPEEGGANDGGNGTSIGGTGGGRNGKKQIANFLVGKEVRRYVTI